MRIRYMTNEYSQQRQRHKPVYVYPVLMAMEATYKKNQGHIVGWNDPQWRNYDKTITEPEGLPFLFLPIPDRVFTNAFDRRYQVYGNYKFHPATHMMAARDCWYAKCHFCEWAKKYPNVETRPIKSVIEEIRQCKEMGFREIFDDSGTFPDGEWLKEFCIAKINAGLGDVVFSCNMRIGANVDFRLMRQAGFRMLLYGIESANQSTLNKLKKGINADEIFSTIVRASMYGLEPHIAVMFGYPWESEEEELKTLKLVHKLLRGGYAKTAQASIYTVAGETAIDRGLTKRIFEVYKSPRFWISKIRDIKRWEDFSYLLKGISKGVKNGLS